MDARIILAGQPVNVLSTMAQGQGLAANQAQMQRTGEEWNLYRTHGAGIAEGDTNALRALAGFDPMAALNARGAHQEMAHADERMALARAAAARAAQTHAAGLTAAQRAEEAQRLARVAAGLAPVIQRYADHPDGVAYIQDAFARAGFEETPANVDDAVTILAGIEGALPILQAREEMRGALFGAEAGPEMTTAMQTLHQRAVAAGLEPGTPAYQEFMATGGRAGPETVIQVGGEGGNWGQDYFQEAYADAQTAATSARQMLGMYDVFERALDTGVRTGFGAREEQALRRFGQFLGMDVNADEMAGVDLMNAVTNRMALLMRSPDSGMGMPGAVSDRDLTFLTEAQVGLDRSPEGNRMMLEAFRRMAQRQIDIARLADEYLRRNGRIDVGFNDVVARFADENPLFADGLSGVRTAAPTGGLSPEAMRFLGDR